MAVVSSVSQSCSHFQSRKQRGGAMTFVFVAKSAKCLAIRQSQPALGSLQCLDSRLFIDTQYHCILRRVQVKPDNVSCLLGKLWIGADTPTPATLEMNPVFAQDPPHVARCHLPQRSGYQSSRPGGIARWQRLIQLLQNPTLHVCAILYLRSTSWLIHQAIHTLMGKPGTPLADRTPTHLQITGDFQSRLSRGCFEHNTGPVCRAPFYGR